MFEQILGIVLTPDRVDFCQINKRLSAKEITHASSHAIPAEIKEMGTQKVGDFIKELCARYHIQPDIVYSALPSSASMFRHLHLPFHDINKLAKVYPYEIEQTLPCSLEDVVMDYHILKTDHVSGTDLLVTVIPKKIFEEHLEILKAAGIEPQVITLDCIGLFFFNQAFSQQDSSQLYGIIELIDKKAILLVTQQNKVFFSRELDWDGRADSDTLDHLCSQIELTLTAFISEHGNPIQKIILTGNPHYTMQMEKCIIERLGISTESFHSYAKLPIRYKKNGTNSAPFIPSVLGLCLSKRFKRGKVWNFRQDIYAYQKSYAMPRYMRYILGAFLILIILLEGFNLKLKSDYHKKYLRVYDNEAQKILDQTIPGVTWGTETLTQLRRAIDKEMNLQKRYQDSIGQEINILDVLRELSILIPKEYSVEVKEIIVQNDRVRVKGITETFEMLDRIKLGISQSKVFQNVKIEEANIKEKGNQVSFDLLLELTKM